MLVRETLKRRATRCAALPDVALELREYGVSDDFARASGVLTDPDRLIRAILSCAHALHRKRDVSRYCDGTYGVFYTAQNGEVALTERTHWAIELVFKMGVSHVVHGLHMIKCSLQGRCVDHFTDWKDHPDIVHPVDYTFCHGIAKQARNLKADYIEVPSARKYDKKCFPVYGDDCIKIHDVKEPFPIYWNGDNERAYVLRNGRRQYVNIEKVYQICTAPHDR